jgi:peptidoglycan/xylan/chitin deacetylase (PgdA/CDA1 family)
VDNLTYALPVFSKHDVPFTIFACTGLINRTHTMWWETVSQLLRDNRSIDFDSGDGTERLDLSRPDRKYAAYRKLSRFIMETDERRAVATIDAIAASYGINAKTSVEETVMDGEQLKAISSHKLVTIGAHTVSHRALARLAQDEAKAELMQSGDDLEALLGHRPTLFAYPYGHKGHAGKREALLARTCGYRFALTTWEATLTADALTRPTALPRISLNGLFQRQRYVSALASGIPFLGRRSADF